jgi:hypothetical protein
MMDRLEVAQRRYDQICPTTKPSPPFGAEELSLWLETDVCAVVEDLVARPDFRGHARWPLERLRDGAQGEERGLVDTVDEGLVECARQLAAVARQPALRKELLRLGPHNDRLPEGDPRGHVRGADGPEGAPVPLDLPVVEYISSRPWRDLVAVIDYFYPVSDLNLTDRERYLGPDSGRVQVGEFLPYFNPRLRPLGDFVSRTLLTRVEYWEGILRRFWVRCDTARQNSRQEVVPPWAAAVTALGQLREAHERLKDRCLAGPEARVRNACIALLQVYAAYRPRADLTWLGLPPAWTRAPVIRHRVERQHDVRLPEQVAAALLDVAPLYRRDMDPAALIEETCRSCALVVVMGQGRREAFWQGRLLDVDWLAQRAQWEFLVELVKHASSKQGVDACDLGDGAPASLKDRRSRLKRLLPKDLDGRIKPAGRGTYILALEPGEIRLLSFEEDERLTAAGV